MEIEPSTTINVWGYHICGRTEYVNVSHIRMEMRIISFMEQYIAMVIMDKLEQFG